MLTARVSEVVVVPWRALPRFQQKKEKERRSEDLAVSGMESAAGHRRDAGCPAHS